MQKSLYKHIIKNAIIIFTVLNCLRPVAFAQESKDKKFEGYQVKFDYEKYPEEREIAYQYYLDHESQYLSGIKKEEIGIDLFDIDDDGNKEIFLYVNGGDRCPRAGCPFATLRKVNKDNQLYAVIPWSIPTGATLSTYENSATKVLKVVTLGYHDILTAEGTELATIWKWNGKYYNIDKVIGK